MLIFVLSLSLSRNEWEWAMKKSNKPTKKPEKLKKTKDAYGLSHKNRNSSEMKWCEVKLNGAKTRSVLYYYIHIFGLSSHALSSVYYPITRAHTHSHNQQIEQCILMKAADAQSNWNSVISEPEVWGLYSSVVRFLKKIINFLGLPPRNPCRKLQKIRIWMNSE